MIGTEALPKNIGAEISLSAGQICSMWDDMEGAVANHKNTWEDCAFYFMPPRSGITHDRSKGEKFAAGLYNSIGNEMLQKFAAGFMGYMTNPSSRWVSLRTFNQKLMDRNDVKVWYKELEEYLFNTFSGSNFYEQMNEMYYDLGLHGTPVMYEEEDPKERVRFYTRPIEECRIMEDNKRRIDTVFRKFKYSSRQAIQAWGDKCPTKVIEAYSKGEISKEFEFIHATMPRYLRDPGKEDNQNLPVGSYYAFAEDKTMVATGGYHEFPYFVPRYGLFKNDPYAWSPSSMALADMKQVNTMEYTLTEAGQIIVRPPILLPHDGFLLPFKMNGGAINYRLPGTNAEQNKVDVFRYTGNLPIGEQMIERKEMKIMKHFFVDLFTMLSSSNTRETATEIVEKVNERMVLLGPVIGRLNRTVLDGVIQRTLAIGARRGDLPPPPEVLMDADGGFTYKIEYVSPLARMQRLQEVNGINSVLAMTGEMAKIIPEVVHKIRATRVVDELSDIYGVNPELIVPEDEFLLGQQQRNDAAAEAQKMEVYERMAGMAKDAGSAQSSLAQTRGSLN